MLAIPRPTFGVDTVIAVCEPTIAHVVAATSVLQAIEAEYATAIDTTLAHSFATSGHGLSAELKAEVDWAYANRLLSKRSAARDYYNDLRLRAPDGACPSCAVRDSAALDHYLPRESFPELAIQPTNLVPICTACNTIKKAHVATAPEDQFLHPYFDDLGSSRWLVADVVQCLPSTLIFRIERPAEWDDVLAARVAKHFERYELVELYAKKSGGFLANHRLAFETLFSSDPSSGADLVQSEALRLADSHEAAGLSPWKATALRAWSDSTWFCNGGWRVSDDVALERAHDRISGRVA